jgi:hypothetical protein
MTRITPLPREAITDPELQTLMAEGEALGVPDELFARIAARARDQAVPLMRALLMSHAQGNVDHKLKEIIRILLARFAKDKYFASLRSTKARDMGLTEKRIDEGCFAYEDDSKGFSEAEKCALRYADLMFLDANQLDKMTDEKALERGADHGAWRLHRVPLWHADVYALARRRIAG